MTSSELGSADPSVSAEHTAAVEPLQPPVAAPPGHRRVERLPALAGPIDTRRLASRTKSAAAFSTGSRIAVQLVQLATTIAMARILSPHDYGLVAIISSFSGFIFLFTDLGIGQAIVYRKVLTPQDLSTAFCLNLLSGFALTVLLSALAVPISIFYHQQALVALIIVSSFGFTLSLNVVHYSLLQRGMRFLHIGVIELAAAVIAGAVGITLALLGAGPMSLVVGSISATACRAVFSWIAVRWLPRSRPTRSALRELWSYSRHVFGFNAIIYWSRNADNLILGRVTTLANLAQYARAYNLMLLPIYQITQVITRVLFPVLAGLRDDLPRLRRGYLRAMTTLMVIGAPATLGLAAVAPAFVRTVYGAKWDAAAPLLAILASSGPAQMINGTFGSLYQATGRVRTQFRRGMVTVSITVAAIGVGAFWGPRGVAIALLIKFYLLLPLNSHGCLPAIGLTLPKVVKPLRGVAVASLVMVAAVLGARVVTPGVAAGAELALQLLVAAIVYPAVLLLVDPGAARGFYATIARRRSRGGRRRDGR